MAIDSKKRPKLREGIMTFLACRPALAFTAGSIAHHIRRDQLIDFSAEATDVEAALTYVEGLGYVRKVDAEMSPEYNWQATTKGVQWAERQGLA